MASMKPSSPETPGPALRLATHLVIEQETRELAESPILPELLFRSSTAAAPKPKPKSKSKSRSKTTTACSTKPDSYFDIALRTRNLGGSGSGSGKDTAVSSPVITRLSISIDGTSPPASPVSPCTTQTQTPISPSLFPVPPSTSCVHLPLQSATPTPAQTTTPPPTPPQTTVTRLSPFPASSPRVNRAPSPTTFYSPTTPVEQPLTSALSPPQIPARAYGRNRGRRVSKSLRGGADEVEDEDGNADDAWPLRAIPATRPRTPSLNGPVEGRKNRRSRSTAESLDGLPYLPPLPSYPSLAGLLRITTPPMSPEPSPPSRAVSFADSTTPIMPRPASRDLWGPADGEELGRSRVEDKDADEQRLGGLGFGSDVAGFSPAGFVAEKWRQRRRNRRLKIIWGASIVVGTLVVVGVVVGLT